MITFKKLSERYIKYNDANKDTKTGYQRMLNRYWLPTLGNKQIHAITYEQLMDCILDNDFQTNKTLNNALVPLRGVFDLAIKMRHINENPMIFIQNKKIQTELPDPFTKEEMTSILDWLQTHMTGQDELYYWFYLLMFWTGLRPSEAFALRWNDVDLDKGTLYVHRTKVRGVEKSVTKTHVARFVYLNKHSNCAMSNLQKFHTQYVVICPQTGKPFFNEKPPRLRLQQAMKATGVRHRPAYNTRHTYATMMLMSGMNPAFVANQLGHSLPMLMKRYARWINNQQDLIEMGKLDMG